MFLVAIFLLIFLGKQLDAQEVNEPLRIEQYADGYLYTQGNDSLYVWWMPGGYPNYVRDDSLRKLIKRMQE